MARLALAVGGGLIGLAIPGAGALGFAIGSTVGGALGGFLFPPEQEDVQGPRLKDLQIQTSTYGQPIPILYGTMRVAGNVIWDGGAIEHPHEEEAGQDHGEQDEEGLGQNPAFKLYVLFTVRHYFSSFW